MVFTSMKINSDKNQAKMWFLQNQRLHKSTENLAAQRMSDEILRQIQTPPAQFSDSFISISPKRLRGEKKSRSKTSPKSGFTLTRSISSLTRIMSQKWAKIRKSNTDLNSKISTMKSPSTATSTPMPVRSYNFNRRPRNSEKSTRNPEKALSWSEVSNNFLDNTFGEEIKNKKEFSNSSSKNEWFMEKSLSEGSLNDKLLPSIDKLRYKSLQLTRSIQEIKEQNQKLIFYLKNPALFSTTEGEHEVKKALAEIKSTIKYTSQQFGSQGSAIELLGSNGSFCSNCSVDDVSQLLKSKMFDTKAGDEDEIEEYESGCGTDRRWFVTDLPKSQFSAIRELADYEGVDLSVSSFVADDLKPTIEEKKIVFAEIHHTKFVENDQNNNQLDLTVIVSDDEYELAEETCIVQIPEVIPQKTCEIIGALTEDCRIISALEMDVIDKTNRYESFKSDDEYELAEETCIVQIPEVIPQKTCEIIGALTEDCRIISALEMDVIDKTNRYESFKSDDEYQLAEETCIVPESKSEKTCEIIGALAKNGRFLSVLEMDIIEKTKKISQYC